jgi:hypothetical protein
MICFIIFNCGYACAVLPANYRKTGSLSRSRIIVDERGSDQVMDSIVVEVQISNTNIFRVAESEGMVGFIL